MPNEHVDTQQRLKFAKALENWLGLPTFRDEREHLEKEENRQVLLDAGCFQFLDKLISSSSTQTIIANIRYNPATFHEQKKEELKREKARAILKQYYAILKDIHQRGSDIQAVEDAYINTHGGLTVVALPPLLQKVQDKIELLRPAAQETSSQDREECRKLVQNARKILQEERKSEQYRTVKSVTRVELQLQLISIPPLRADDEALNILKGALGEYTLRKYPLQYARVQRMLANSYVELFNKDSSKLTELTSAITHYKEALDFYVTLEHSVNLDHLEDQIIHVEASLLETHSLLLLLSQPQKALHELITDALTLEKKLVWTTLEDTLRRKIGEVCRNAKARISYVLKQQKRLAQATALLEYGCQWRQHEFNEFMTPFIDETQDTTLLKLEGVIQGAVQARTSHIIIYLVATLRGGFASIVSSNQFSSSASFAVLDLPELTDKVVAERIERTIVLEDSPDSKVVGGFAHALNRAGNTLFNTWHGKTLYDQLSALKETHKQELSTQKGSSDRPTTQILLQAVEDTLNTLSTAWGWKTLYDQLSALKETSDQPDAQKLIQAVEDTLNKLIADKPGVFTATLDSHFLRIEVEHIFETFQRVLRPLIKTIINLSKAGIQEVTLIPYGSLAALPLATILETTNIANHQLLGELVSISILPSAQTLLDTEMQAPSPVRSTLFTTSVYTLGDPLPPPSHKKSFPWWQADALILKEEASRSPLALTGSAVAKIRTNATKKWFKKVLQEGHIVEAGCHCTLDIEAPLQSKLFLASNEELMLLELLHRSNPDGSIDDENSIRVEGLRLFIIASCKMEIKGERDLYDEAQSFTGILLQAGMKAVLASYWNVSEEATYLLLRYFAQKWMPCMHEKQPAKALFEAKIALSTITNKELMLEAALFLDRLKEADITNRYVTEFNTYRAYEQIYSTASKGDPHKRPFADPIYWAGFQVFGW